MRTFYLIVLLLLLVAVLVFAVQNTQAVTLHFPGAELTTPLAQMVIGVYVLGMLSGATVVGLLNRLLRRATHR
jgi:uncharacterized integral membrane protein